MKLNHILPTLALLASLGLSTTSCDDMLTVDTGDKSYVSANDTLYSYLGIAKQLQNVAERQIILNELRGDLCVPTEYVTDTLSAIANFESTDGNDCSMLRIADYYAVINNCNLYLASADTNLVRGNKKFMLPEYAQVQAIRAWTYMQLVNLYGEVPFISEPIASLDVVKNFDYQANLVNADNLVDRLVTLGLDRYVDTDYPSYGNYNNGAVNISSRLLFLPIRLLLGDLYLQRGRDQADFRKAAQYYYDYLRKDTNTPFIENHYYEAIRLSADKLDNVLSDEDLYSYNMYGPVGWASFYEFNQTSEVIASIPSSANSQYGTMLTRVADIFGYTPTSSQQNQGATNEDGEETVSSSGAISVMPSSQAQILPSPSYVALNRAQHFVYWKPAIGEREDYTCGDTRLQMSTQQITISSDLFDQNVKIRFCSKAARNTTFYYTVPLYRKTLVWLRLAEAINRAGYPEHAFAILKDGLNAFTYPVQGEQRPVTDENGDPVLDDEGQPLTETYTRYNNYGALHYVDDSELSTFFLDFKGDEWDITFGTHAIGCGHGKWEDHVKTTSPITNITGYNDSIYFDYAPRLAEEGVDVTTASQADIINAVENVICDELALEGCFEGIRFTDLSRMARHKNAAGVDGTKWFAAKIADRNVQTSADGTTTAVTRDEQLYNRLLTPSAWYLTKPEWSVK